MVFPSSPCDRPSACTGAHPLSARSVRRGRLRSGLCCAGTLGTRLVGEHVLARGCTLQDTITPAVLGTLTTLLIIPLSILLMRPMGAEGLALATTLGISLQSLAIFLALRKKLRGLHAPGILRSLKRLTVSAGLTALVCWGARQLLHAIPAVRRHWRNGARHPGPPLLACPGIRKHRGRPDRGRHRGGDRNTALRVDRRKAGRRGSRLPMGKVIP